MADEEETEEESKSNVPIDRGWAWMILIGTSLIYFILVGTYKAFGIFFVAIIEKYNSSVTVATLIGAIYNVMYIIVSVPILTVGIQHISTRKICATGAVIFSVGYILSSVAPSIEWLVVIQSVLCGGADALLMAPAVILLGKYFKKRRGLANGIAFAHISLGSLVLPNFFRYIVEEYGLQGAFILTAGLTMNMLVAASLFRPLSFYSKRRRKNDSNDVVKIGEKCDEDGDKDLKHTDYNDTFPKNKNLDLSMQLLPIRNTERFKSHSSEFINHDGEPNKLFPSMRSLCAIEVHFSGSVTSLAREPEELQESPLTSNNSEVNTNKSKSLGNRCNNFSFLRNFHVLQNKQFLIFSFVIASGSIATVNIFTFIPHHAEQRGVDKTRAALLVSIMSGTDFFGRLLCGYLADRQFIKRTTIILISQIIVCALLFSTQLYSQFWALVLFCACSGFFLGMITTLMAPITVDILGIDAFGAGMTVILVMMSISHGASMVIMGSLRDYTGDYLASFYYLGSTSSVSVLLSLVVLRMSK